MNPELTASTLLPRAKEWRSLPDPKDHFLKIQDEVNRRFQIAALKRLGMLPTGSEKEQFKMGKIVRLCNLISERLINVAAIAKAANKKTPKRNQKKTTFASTARDRKITRNGLYVQTGVLGLPASALGKEDRSAMALLWRCRNLKPQLRALLRATDALNGSATLLSTPSKDPSEL